MYLDRAIETIRDLTAALQKNVDELAQLVSAARGRGVLVLLFELSYADQLELGGLVAIRGGPLWDVSAAHRVDARQARLAMARWYAHGRAGSNIDGQSHRASCQRAFKGVRPRPAQLSLLFFVYGHSATGTPRRSAPPVPAAALPSASVARQHHGLPTKRMLRSIVRQVLCGAEMIDACLLVDGADWGHAGLA